jgi:maltooligosyltrehalose trehalohydrolase
VARRFPVGAEVSPEGAHFRVWAPRCKRVDVVIEGGAAHRLQDETGGYRSAFVRGARAGDRYRFRLDEGDRLVPDPASRFQPNGPNGASQLVSPSDFQWTDAEWAGIELKGQIIYEMHVGTFTREGTWAAAASELENLRGLCTTIEMMPIGDFAGTFGWGYDVVDFFAPTRLYGTPDDLRAFVDRAHALGFGVVLDVVYNHVGPSGCFLGEFSDTYFTDRYKTDWGAAINYDGPGSEGVREFFLANSEYWIEEFRFDGLRLDATQNIYDETKPHVLSEIGRRVRSAARGRKTIVVAENEPQDTRLLHAVERGGYGLDAAWNDDFHHSALVALTGQTEAYLDDYRGSAQELVSAVKRGFLFQGQRYAWQKARRGTSTRGIAPERFVTFLENHDQVANSARGWRLTARTHPGRLRALTALVMLAPGTPMLFQGQEFASSAPFEFFADHEGDLAAAVRAGRAKFLCQFPSVATDEMRATLDDPGARSTFEKCKLDPAERERNVGALALHRDLVALRHDDPTVRSQGAHGVDGAVLGPSAFVIRLFGETELADRLLVVNLGGDLTLVPAPEPLLAPPAAACWSLVWSSEHPRYGGHGVSPPDTDDGWRIRGESASLLAAPPVAGAERTSRG